MESRTAKASKNIIFGLFAKMLALVLGFVSRTVFISYIGEFYLGVSGLYTNILSLLSFAELGFGTAMNFAMYKPVAEGDELKCAQLTQFFKKVYRIIALIVFVVGMCLVPCLQYLIKDIEGYSYNELRTYYVLYLLNSVVSYFVTYKYCLVNAMEKTYIINTIEMLVNLGTSIIQIIVVVVAKQFFWYLLAQTLILIVSRVFISVYLNKRVPLLTRKPPEKLPEQDRQMVIKNVRGLIIHNFSSIMIHATDNIIISAYIGVVLVGYVSNYNLLISSVVAFVRIIFDNIIPSFGNLVATESPKECLKVYRQLDLISSWMYGFMSVAFLILIPPFITLWIGEGFLIDDWSFLLIIISNYLLGESSVYIVARNAKGDFNKDKWWALAHAIVNLVVSIVAVQYLGLVGVYIGTIVSRMVALLGKPMATYKYMFDESVIKYYLRILYYFIVTVIACVVTYLCTFKILEVVTIPNFIYSVLLCAVVPNIVFLLFYFNLTEFKEVIVRIKEFFVKIKEFIKVKRRPVLNEVSNDKSVEDAKSTQLESAENNNLTTSLKENSIEKDALNINDDSCSNAQLSQDENDSRVEDNIVSIKEKPEENIKETDSKLYEEDILKVASENQKDSTSNNNEN